MFSRNALAVAIAVSYCVSLRAEQLGSESSATLDEKSDRMHAAILENLPTNSDKRCVGIATVAEALLDGKASIEASNLTAEQLAQRIYNQIATGKTVAYTLKVVIDKEVHPVTSQAVLSLVSTLVADHYKQDYLRLMKTERGRDRVVTASDTVIGSREELMQILSEDPDHITVFTGEGIRLFPNKKLQKTRHAFLVGKLDNNTLFVYDPNDPSQPICCRHAKLVKGLVLRWSCRYRDTGEVTTQQYYLVHQQDYFQRMLGGEK